MNLAVVVVTGLHTPMMQISRNELCSQHGQMSAVGHMWAKSMGIHALQLFHVAQPALEQLDLSPRLCPLVSRCSSRTPRAPSHAAAMSPLPRLLGHLPAVSYFSREHMPPHIIPSNTHLSVADRC